MERIINSEKNSLYPIFLKAENIQTLLVGGGNVGLEKSQSLLNNSPEIKLTIVAPLIKEELKELASKYNYCRIIERKFDLADLDNKQLVICATDDLELHKTIKAESNRRNILVNVADTPGLCDFYLSSIVQKGSLKIAISTNGKSPTIAKRIKEVLNHSIPQDIDTSIDNINILRNRLNGNFTYKVKKLNTLTKSLIDNESIEKEKRWRKIATWSILAFAFMLIGHFIFSYIPLSKIGNDAVSLYNSLDKNFHWMLLAGFLAQLVDGALGMGYGVTSATILLSAGISPAAISGSIHTAETFAAGVSGYSHYKFGNVNKKLFKALVIPGVIGAVLGAFLLVFLGDKLGNYLRPFIAIYTLFLGIKFLVFAFRANLKSKKFKHYSLLAAIGGFFDSFGGGGWGPIVTTTLINNGRSHKYVVGSVSLTEFFVTIASAFTFFTLLGVSHWQTILALIVGGTIAAPIAARLAGKLPRKTAFILLGILVIIWSIRILIKLF